MVLEHRGRRPVIPASAYVSPTATVCGAVVLGERTRILRGAVLTAEDGEIQVGSDVIDMEHALVEGRDKHRAGLGDTVLVGPHAHVNGAPPWRTRASWPPAPGCSPVRWSAWLGAADQQRGACRVEGRAGHGGADRVDRRG